MASAIEERPPEKTSASNTAADTVSFIAKWQGCEIELLEIAADLAVGDLKQVLEDETCVPAARQKIIGLKLASGGKAAKDDALLSALARGKAPAEPLGFILMGTPEDQLFVDPKDRAASELPQVCSGWCGAGALGDWWWLCCVTRHPLLIQGRLRLERRWQQWERQWWRDTGWQGRVGLRVAAKRGSATSTLL